MSGWPRRKCTDGTEALKQLTYLAGALKAPVRRRLKELMDELRGRLEVPRRRAGRRARLALT